MHLIVAALVQKDRCERTNFPCPEDQNSMHRRPRSLSIIPLCSIRQSFAFTSVHRGHAACPSWLGAPRENVRPDHLVSATEVVYSLWREQHSGPPPRGCLRERIPPLNQFRNGNLGIDLREFTPDKTHKPLI